MPQYFSSIAPKEVKYYPYEADILGHKFTLYGTSGTFSKEHLDDGTKYLLETIFQMDLGTKILDMGCGTGPIGLILAASDPSRHITMCDVNRRALDLAEENAKALGISSQVDIVESDVYLSINSTFSSIVSNPPIRAGKKVTYAIYDGAKAHLEKDGSLYLVVRRQQGAESVEKHLLSLFNKVEVLRRKKGFWIIKATNKE